MIALQKGDFELLCFYIRQWSGIDLGPGKEYLVELRLQSLLKKHRLSTFADLLFHLKFSPGIYKRDLIEAMVTGESSFFRDQTPFRWFAEHWLPSRAQNSSKLRIWSAACSTGQEVWSLAMLVAQFQSRKAVDVEIIGTDLSEKALIKARSGEYSQLELSRGLDADLLSQYWKPHHEKHRVINDEIKSMVRFLQMNLLEPKMELGRFDLIFCRNVAIYFDTATRQKLWTHLAHAARQDCFLLLGSSEQLGEHPHWQWENSQGQSYYRLRAQ